MPSSYYTPSVAAPPSWDELDNFSGKLRRLKVRWTRKFSRKKILKQSAPLLEQLKKPGLTESQRIDLHTKLKKIDPTAIRNYDALIQIYLRRDVALSKATLIDLLELYPRNWKVRNIAALFYENIGYPDHAIRFLDFEADDAQNFSIRYFRTLSRLAFATNTIRFPLRILQATQHLWKGDAHVVSNTCQLFLRAEDYQSAMQLAEQFSIDVHYSGKITRLWMIAAKQLGVEKPTFPSIDPLPNLSDDDLYHLIDSHIQLGNYAAAEKAIQAKLEATPDSVAFLTQQAMLLMFQNEYTKAISTCNKILKLVPRDGRAIRRKLTALVHLEEFEKAQKFYPVFAKTLFKNVFSYEKFIFHASQGHYSQAYEDYRYRPTTKDMLRLIPGRIDANTITDNINVLAEGGPGDELRFSSLYETLIQKYSKVTLTCEPRLQAVLQRTYPEINFIPIKRFRMDIPFNVADRSDRVPSRMLADICSNEFFEKAVQEKNLFSMLELIPLLRPELSATIPRRSVNIAVEKSKYWEEKFAGRQRCVGLSWRSELVTPARNIHYLELEQLLPLFKIDASFVLLQSSITSEEMEILKNVPQEKIVFLDPSKVDLYNDFDETAAMLSNLEQVISPCTTLGEFAGVLNIKTLMFSNSSINNYKADAEGRDIWNPSIKYIRPDNFGDKNQIVERIAAALN